MWLQFWWYQQKWFPKAFLKQIYLKYRLWHNNMYPWRHEQNLIMWLKSYFMSSHVTKVCLFAFLWEKLKKPQFCKDFTRETTFSKGWCWFEFDNLGLALDITLEFYIRVTKLLKLKAKGHKVSGAISYISEVVGGKW